MAGTDTPLRPSATLLVKIGSFIVHAREALRPGRSAFARMQLDLLSKDGELNAWLRAMDERELLPASRVTLVSATSEPTTKEKEPTR